MSSDTKDSSSSNGTKKSIEVVDPDSGAVKEETVNEKESGEGELNKENREGLLKIFTKALGLDITNITLPVTVCEPVSFLMRLAEGTQYSDLLDKASNCDNSLERLMYVSIYAVTVYNAVERIGKPFNPLLGETFEYVDESRGNFRFLAEQVSHHPPIGSCVAENENWRFWQTQCLKTKFTGNSLDCFGTGSMNVYLKRTKEHFKWEAVKSVCHNLIVGKIWLDHFGDFEIVNKTTGEKTKMKMKQCGWFSKGWHEIEGEVLDTKGNCCIHLTGKWTEAIYGRIKDGAALNYDNAESTDTPINGSPSEEKSKKDLKKEKKQQKKDLKEFQKQVKKKLTSEEPLWTHTSLPVPADKIPNKFLTGWTELTFKMAHVDDEMRAYLPPTDSRLRGDRYALERNEVKKAGTEKHALEEKQREERRQREKEGKTWTPRHFKLSHDEDGQEFWEYAGGYWETREEKIKASAEKK